MGDSCPRSWASGCQPSPPGQQLKRVVLNRRHKAFPLSPDSNPFLSLLAAATGLHLGSSMQLPGLPEAPGVLIATTPTPPVRHGIGVRDVQPWKSHKGKPRVVAGAKPTSCREVVRQDASKQRSPFCPALGHVRAEEMARLAHRGAARNQCANAPNDIRGTHRPAASCVVLCTRQASPLLMTMSPPLPSFGFALRHNLGQNPAANNGTYLERGESG